MEKSDILKHSQNSVLSMVTLVDAFINENFAFLLRNMVSLSGEATKPFFISSSLSMWINS